MGKPTACLKIIACGNNDSVDRDDLEAPDAKGSSDRRGWSFRKRSSRHRVLSNTANSEIANKESPESHVVDFQTQPNIAVQEKATSVEWTEMEGKSDLTAQPDSNLSDTQKEDQLKEDVTIDESCVITIQAAIRGFLARKLLLKQTNNVIKLQAAVRGHLVRMHAVGTLRCVQAIIKMQALVRARRARKDDLVSTALHKKEPKSSGGPHTYVSIATLLNNSFARQLMETTPRTQPIRIKCEPLKSDSDSAWKWLERWMSVSSVNNEEPCESSEPQATEHPGKETLDCSVVSSDDNSKVLVAETEEEDDNDDLISHEANNVDVNAWESMSPSPSETQNSDELNTRYREQESVDPIETEERGLSSDMGGEEYIRQEKEAQNEAVVPELKVSSSTEQPEIEAKKSSRTSSNPAFVAAQSKFEELSSAANAKEMTSFVIDTGTNPGSYKVNDSADELKDNAIAHDDSISIAPRVQTVASECGTELSITSTLDSTDNSSDYVVNDLEQERKVSDQTLPHIRQDVSEIEAKGNAVCPEVEVNKETDPSQNTSSDKSEKHETTNPVMNEPVDSLQEDEKPLADENDLKNDEGSEISHVAYKSSSPNASPQSHATVTESQATPSSQVSFNKRKKSGGEKTKSSVGKAKPSSSGDKKAVLKRDSQDSATKNSSDHKTGKRQAKQLHDDKEQEARDSSSSNSLPSYMQATESARAKAIANGSPRSSPDMHDKDLYLRKRHSLPGASERQGSPRIHRSLSQATQQNAKGNGTQSPQDRKWRR